MAVRGGASIATAIGMAAGAGAAQLGLGYGLGIIAWQSATGASDAVWVGSLVWATWIAANSTVVGAVCADRLSSLTSGRGPTTVMWRMAIALAAAFGALITVALVAVPARVAVRTDTFSPQTIAAGYAAMGVIVGLLAATAALASRAAAGNLLATACWLWALAVIAVVHGVVAGRGLGSAQLGVWQLTPGDDRFWMGNLYWPGVLLMLSAALVIGGLAAMPAALAGADRIGVAVSGVLGPLLVAIAYLMAAPRLGAARDQQASAYLTAPYAVIAGLAGSVLVAAWVQRHRHAHPTPAAAGDDRTATGAGDTGISGRDNDGWLTDLHGPGYTSWRTDDDRAPGGGADDTSSVRAVATVPTAEKARGEGAGERDEPSGDPTVAATPLWPDVPEKRGGSGRRR